MTKTARMVKLAFDKGYRVVGEEVISPTGHKRKINLKARYAGE